MTVAIALLVVNISARAGSIDLHLRHQFKIPSESLNAALAAFSAQSGIRLVTPGMPTGVLSSGVNGNLSALDAIGTLLRGTGMSFRQIDAETLVVVPVQMAQLRPTQFQPVGNVSEDALADQPTAAAPAAAAPTELTEVQVTGTRIIRQGYEAPTPVTAVGISALQDSAQPNIGDTLTELPMFQGSATTTSSTSFGGEGDYVELNLRNLTPSRTLILFDGRRLPTANPEAVPNLTLIPDGLIQRVDVVTGGASAVYGSDAVAGVVNFVLDTNFTGIKGLLEGGISGYGDGPSDKIQLTLGTTFFDGRLHLLLSGDQSYQQEVNGIARPWNTGTQPNFYQNPAYATNKSAPEYLLSPCCVSTTYPAGGLILSGPLQGTTFGIGGAVEQYNYGVGLTAPGDDQYGGSWQTSTMHGGSDVLPAETDTHFFVRLAFDIRPNIQVYAELIDASDHTNSRCCFDYYQGGVGTLYTSNPYLPASVVAEAAADAVTSFSVGDSLRFPTNMGSEGGLGDNNFRYKDVYVLGLKGKLNVGKNSYHWNLYGQQGISIENFGIDEEAIKQNLSNAIEAVRVGSYGPNNSYTGLNGATLVGYTAANYPNPLRIANGTITCLSNLLPLNNPGETTNCVPFNIFGTKPCAGVPGGQCNLASAAAYAYTQGWARLREVGEESIVGGDITGEPFSTWAGPVSVALDAEYRHEAVNGFNDPISEESGFFSTNFSPFVGSDHVSEGAVEAVVPLVKGVPGVQELDVNGAARATDYSVSGYVTTYKYGLEYTPISDLRFRATVSSDIRAPSLSNLYAYASAHGTNVDPFENNASIPSYTITGSNPNLRAEKAHQYEIGLVFQPSELPGFNLSVDYYHINITGAISSLTAAYELQQCYNTRIPGTFTGTSPLCALIVRTPCTPCLGTRGLAPGTLYSVETIPFNIAAFLASGVDYDLDYRKQLTELVPSWKGAVGLNLSATYTIHDITNTGIAGPAQILDSAGTDETPRWAVFATLSYELDRWHFSWQERFDSAILGNDNYITCHTNCPNPIPAGFSTLGFVPRVPTYFRANLAVAYKFMEHDQQEAAVFINVNNVFNRAPPWFMQYEGSLFDTGSVNNLYDTIGLYARAGVRFRF